VLVEGRHTFLFQIASEKGDPPEEIQAKVDEAAKTYMSLVEELIDEGEADKAFDPRVVLKVSEHGGKLLHSIEWSFRTADGLAKETAFVRKGTLQFSKTKKGALAKVEKALRHQEAGQKDFARKHRIKLITRSSFSSTAAGHWCLREVYASPE